MHNVNRHPRLRRLFVLISIMVLAVMMNGSIAMAAASARNLAGKWHCFYAYDRYWGNQNMDDVYYTFWGTTDRSGQYSCENRTQNYSYSGTFTMTERSDGTWIIFTADGYEEEFLFTWSADGQTFTIDAPDIYYAHYEKQ